MIWHPQTALLRRTPPLLLFAAGLLMAFHPTLLSGMEQIQVYPNDSVFNQIVLEHGWLWLVGRSPRGFWDAPFGYPMPNLMATCDLFLSFAPLYWVWRALGFHPLVSFSLWMFSVSAANFATCYLLLRRCFGATVLAGSLGAFVFAFASARMGHLNTQQLLPHFYLVLVIWGICRVFDARVPRRRRVLWTYLALGALAAQFYGGFYNGMFLLIYLAAALPWALALGSCRRRLLETTRTLWFHGLVAGGLSAAVMLPLASRYLTISLTAGERSPEMGGDTLPRLQSWLYHGQFNWLYGWTSQWESFRSLPVTNEHILASGLLSACLAVVGLWCWRRRPAVQLMVLVSLTVVALFTYYPNDWQLWDQLYKLPAMKAIRLPSRIGLLLLLPMAVGLAAWLGRSRSGWRRWLAVTAAAVCCLEQGGTTDSFSLMVLDRETRTIAARVDQRATAFMVLPPDGTLMTEYTEHRAMWAALLSGVPTFNFTTGAVPMRWPFDRYFLPGERGFSNADIRETLKRWLRQHALDPGKIQVIELQQGNIPQVFRGKPFLAPQIRCPGPPDVCPPSHGVAPPPAGPEPTPPGPPPPPNPHPLPGPTP